MDIQAIPTEKSKVDKGICIPKDQLKDSTQQKPSSLLR